MKTTNPANIYSYCPNCKKAMYFVGRTKTGWKKPIMQCPCCRECWTVPESWVKNLEMRKGFGTPDDLEIERRENAKLRNLQFRKIIPKDIDSMSLKNNKVGE
jgi:hypothetical protein